MLSWKEKVAEKLSRLFADSPSSSSHLPMDSPVVRPEPPPQTMSLCPEEVPSPKKPALSSYFSSLPATVSNIGGDKANTSGIRSLSLRSFQRKWKANGISWQDQPLRCNPDCETGNKSDETIMIIIESKGDTSGRNIKNTDGMEEASSDYPRTIISGESKDDISARIASSRNVMEEASTSHDTYDRDEFLCYLTERSTFINANLFEFFQSSLPNIVKGCKWVLVYSTWKHGISLRTLLRRSVNLPGPCLLIVGDMQGAVFGGLLDSSLKPTAKRKYQGTNQTFLFTTIYGEPRLFRATGANRYYYLCLNDVLAFGGGENFALCLDEDLLHGTSGPCETFGNLCLARSPEFELKNVELWGFTHSSLHDT